MQNRRLGAQKAAWVLGAFVFACAGEGNELGHLKASVVGDMRYTAIEREPYDAWLGAACGPGGVLPEREQDIPRWPYLQNVTPDSAEILFTSEVARDFRVVARTPKGETLLDTPAEVEAGATPSVGTQYHAVLTGLPPDATVCYELTADGTSVTAPAGFRTAPDPMRASKVRFAAMGDLGKRSSDQFAVLEQLERVPLDLLLLTGDVAYDNGSREQLEQNFFGVYRQLIAKVPVFAASGNHDYNTEDGQPFRDAFALPTNGGIEGQERWYSFDWGPVHFVVLDTERVGDAQARWLDEDLDAHDRPWTIAVAHRPPFSSGHHGSSRAVREAFTPIFEAHRVPLVLLGHEHNYERTKPLGGVVYVVTGGGGRGTRGVSGEAFSAVADQVAHFVWVEADTSALRLVAIDATGEPFDSIRFEHAH